MPGYIVAIGDLSIDDSNSLRVKVSELTNKTKQDDYIIKTRLSEKEKEIESLKQEMVAMQENQVLRADRLKELNEKVEQLTTNNKELESMRKWYQATILDII